MNIVRNFPEASIVREMAPIGLQNWAFEHRLKLLRKRILTAASTGGDNIHVDYVHDQVRDYLIEKGYTVSQIDEHLYKISWASES